MSIDGSGTIPVGGGAVLLFSGAIPANGYEVCNVDETYDLWVSDTATASINGAGSIRIGPGGGTYTTPRDYHPLGPVSAFTNKASGHRVTARAWGPSAGSTEGATGPIGPPGPPGPTGSSGSVTAEGGLFPRSMEERAADVVNARDYLKGDGTPEDPAAFTAMMDFLISCNAGGSTQNPGPNAKTLFFPGGRYTFSTFTILNSWGAGTSIRGDGMETELDGLGIDLHHRGANVRNITMRGAGAFGIRTSGDGIERRQVMNVYVTERDIGYLIEDHGGPDSWIGCDSVRCKVGLRVTECDREQHFVNCHWGLFYEDGVQLWPKTGSSSVQGCKFVNCMANSAEPSAINYNGKGWHLKANPPDGNVFECYFVNCTGSLARRNRPIPFTAVADIGGGLVRFTTSASHGLLPLVRDLEIDSGSSYVGVYTVVATPDETHFDITHAFTGTGTGTARIDGWDIYCDVQGALINRIHSLFFTGGNFNHSYLVGSNFNFANVRLTEEIWIQDVVQCTFAPRVFRGRAGDASHSIQNVPRGGPGAYRGWAEIGNDTGTPTTLLSYINYLVMRSPDPDGGLIGLLPAVTHEVRVTPDAIRLHSDADIQIRNAANTAHGNIQAAQYVFPLAADVRVKAAAGVLQVRNYLDGGYSNVEALNYSFPAAADVRFKASANILQVRNYADDGYAGLEALNYVFPTPADVRLKATTGGILQVRNHADSTFALVGALGYVFPDTLDVRLKATTGLVQVRNFADSAYAAFEARTLRTTPAYTVAGLPAAGSAGRRAYVNNALGPVWGSPVAAGGTVVVPVFDNGTAWIVG